MRGDRLLAILLMLQAEGKLTQQELARRLEVSERTIQRDMDALGSAGVPVLSERGSSGGWKLMEGYTTDVTGMTSEEWKALLLSAGSRASRDLGFSGALDSALLKLRAAGTSNKPVIADSLSAKLLVDAEGWNEAPQSQTKLPLLFESVWSEQLIEAMYESRTGSDAGRLRSLMPLGLVLKGMTWYLAASEGGVVKSFRISKLSGISLTGQSAPRPPSFSLASWWQSSVNRFIDSLPSVQVALKVTPAGMERLKKMRYTVIVEENSSSEKVELTTTAGIPNDISNCNDMPRLVTVTFNTLDYAASVVLSLSPEVEAVEPPQLRMRVRQLAEQALEKHT